MKRITFKVIRDTKTWKKGQNVFYEWGTGALAAYVKGRYKGKGRWVGGWVHYADKDGKAFNCRPDAVWLS